MHARWLLVAAAVLLSGAEWALRPEGYAQYCAAYGDQDPGCGYDQARRAPKVLHYDVEMQRVVGSIQKRVNTGIQYTRDIDAFGLADWWTFFDAAALARTPKPRGDCEDYAITKLHLLVAAGVPRENLHLVFAQHRQNGAGHAVLVVKTGQGDWVLDNAYDEPMPVAYLRNEYRWHSEELPFSGGRWVAYKP